MKYLVLSLEEAHAFKKTRAGIVAKRPIDQEFLNFLRLVPFDNIIANP